MEQIAYAHAHNLDIMMMVLMQPVSLVVIYAEAVIN
jgi:uncharacterized radical SAM superfamily Fe-S cluster-containing enzyme